MRQTIFILFFLLSADAVFGQASLDSLQQLEEVLVKADKNLKAFSNTQQVSTLKGIAISRSSSLLTDLLNTNSLIYFKENGLGMVSSPAFRGTTAQQTAVVWNGININSQFNGQTDFNTINTLNFDEISVRSGGGSVLYGSGAIGGTIHMDNLIRFKRGFENRFFAKYGSFDSQDISYMGGFSNEKWSFNISSHYSHSDNDYDFVDGNRKNLNGEFHNLGLTANIGYKINTKNILKYYSYIYDGERHFSLIHPSETPTKYQDLNTRHLLEYNGLYGKLLSTLKLAYVAERYKYFANINKDSYTFGEAKTLIGKYNLGYQVFKDAYLESVFDVTYTSGEGSSIGESERTVSGFSLLFKHKLKNFLYEATARQEVTNNYESPVLFSLGLEYRFTPNYSLKINGSKNFRIPTYNDLYWAGSGNSSLKPETSYQLELGNEFVYKGTSLSIIGFYNDITDMIRWLPKGSVWLPLNTDKVETYGLETRLGLQRTFGLHQFNVNVNYGYTISKNKETSKQLIYVPFHKASGTFNYTFKKISLYWQSVYTGEVFQLSDNNPRYVIEDYLINNFGLEYHFGKQATWLAGAQIRNILNEDCQSVDNRYMPGINYNFYINFNF